MKECTQIQLIVLQDVTETRWIEEKIAHSFIVSFFSHSHTYARARVRVISKTRTLDPAATSSSRSLLNVFVQHLRVALALWEVQSPRKCTEGNKKLTDWSGELKVILKN